MTVFMDYKYVDEGGINALEMTSDENDIKSVQIFESVDVERIVDYVLNSYYRNYSLYMYVFGVQTIVTVKQQAAEGVELPHINMPLQMGTLIPVTQGDEMETQQ
eukprot:gene21634-24533_t